MIDPCTPRTFVVTVRSAPSRVVVEDVRGGLQVAAADVAAAGAQIERWLERPAVHPAAQPRDPSAGGKV